MDGEPKPQTLRWKPRRRAAQIVGDGLIHWEQLKKEFEELFEMVPGIRMPILVKTADSPTDPLKQNWNIVGIDSTGDETAHVWIGHNPEKPGRPWDGLVRVANALNSSEVWGVFQRYSDNSYRRLEHPGPPPFCYAVTFINEKLSPLRHYNKVEYEKLMEQSFDVVVNELEFTMKVGNEEDKSISTLSPTQAMMLWLLLKAVLERSPAIHHHDIHVAFGYNPKQTGAVHQCRRELLELFRNLGKEVLGEGKNRWFPVEKNWSFCWICLSEDVQKSKLPLGQRSKPKTKPFGRES